MASETTEWTAHSTEPAGVKDTLVEFLSRKRVLMALTLLPALSLFVIMIVVPVVWTIAASFNSISAFSPEWTWVGLENYRVVLSDPQFGTVLSRSIYFATGSVLLQLVLGTGIALLINRSFKLNSVARAVVMLPYLIPTAIVAYLALWMLNSQWGIINQLLVQAGLINQHIAWLGSPELAMLIIILVNSWKFSIFVTIMVLARLQGIPTGFYEAAQMAGASRFQQFRDITLPNLKGVIFIVLLLRGVWMFNKFDIIWILTGGGPINVTTTAPIYAYKTAFNQYALGRSAAISTILFGMLSVVAALYFYRFDPSKEVRVE
ncbi:multiple sugar transport system permease protein [Halogranum rubrum]|uniref:Multiple sugar transport system permease protein n=1 Tax=Halogranum rubrum TaxID=553466 RepID=A0A1I4JQ81_9EURY|nr:sugar ABC transporter permease [Halogranum rubrum]SFL68755.1 multiple sugar transport system permease protein [Halogranum rubrum]